jgi:CubicO group peptidase (beta-lactamase class C family)
MIVPPAVEPQCATPGVGDCSRRVLLRAYVLAIALASLAPSTSARTSKPSWTRSALPQQDPSVPWPVPWPEAADTLGWPKGRDMCEAADYLFDQTSADYDPTHGLLIVRRGELVCERYFSRFYHAYFPFWTWSVSKSLVHLIIGILVRQGRINIHAPVAHYCHDLWPTPTDSRRNISVNQLLQMRSGLAWTEIDDDTTMLFGPGRTDMGAFAADRPAEHPAGTFWRYSTGTTNIVTRVIRDVVGGPTALLQLLEEEVVGPMSMIGLQPGFDGGGTYVGSSYLSAPIHDVAKIGLLYLRDGVWNGRRILPEGWVDHARTPSYIDNLMGYGAHWWINPRRPSHFFASGTGGQRLYLVPEDDLIIVRFGAASQKSYNERASGSHLGCGSQCEQPFWLEKLDPLVDQLVENLRRM